MPPASGFTIPSGTARTRARSRESSSARSARPRRCAPPITRARAETSGTLACSPSPQGQGHRIWRDESRKLGVFPSPWGGGGWGWGTANKERDESAPTPNPSPRSQRKHAARGGGEHGESASPFPLKCDGPANKGEGAERSG